MFSHRLPHSPIRVYPVRVLADIGKVVWSAAPASLVAAGARVFVLAQWAECACGSLGAQAAPTWGPSLRPWRSRNNNVRQLSGTIPFRLIAILGLKCIAGMKTTQCTARSRFGPNPHWRSPHFRAEGTAGAMRLLQKEEVREEGAGAVAREGYVGEVSVSQSGSEAVELRACWRSLCPPSRGFGHHHRACWWPIDQQKNKKGPSPPLPTQLNITISISININTHFNINLQRQKSKI